MNVRYYTSQPHKRSFPSRPQTSRAGIRLYLGRSGGLCLNPEADLRAAPAVDMPKVGGFGSFNSARQTIAGYEAMLWLRKGFGLSGGWTVNDQNDLPARLFGLQKVNKV